MILDNCDIDLWRHKQTLNILWYWFVKEDCYITNNENIKQNMCDITLI